MSVTIMRVPVLPSGWPRATAPPLTLTMSLLSPSSRMASAATQAKASLSSASWTSLLVRPAFSRAAWAASVSP